MRRPARDLVFDNELRDFLYRVHFFYYPDVGLDHRNQPYHDNFPDVVHN